ncbi:MAG: ABC transporter ATP-binding protein [Candidatus Eremiobacteraeota bacterium]|nr:ABC transporter ATP-binding protein [Candidatus Eremiobacteraeota bacterium]
MRGIVKNYSGVKAVDSVDLTVYEGEIHALVGENGAGKSTLANIAFGSVRADAGTIVASGTVGLVHQHFELLGRLRVWQNVLLGREPRRGLRIDAAAARARVSDLAHRNELDIDPDAYVDDLPVGIAQRVELLRELERDPTVLLLDEPTASLAPAEIAAFFATIEQLAARGTAVLIVTHKLQEVIAFTQRVSVMRRGRIVAAYDTHSTNVDEIARSMVGGDLPKVAARETVALNPCMVAEHLSAGTGSAAISDLSLQVRGGEIVGIAGVEGNGQSTLADAIAGLAEHAGTISTLGGRGMIPQDRHKEALVMNWGLADNALLGRQHGRGALVNRQSARDDAQRIVDRFDVRAASLDVAVRTLSGGNQQKLVVGRALLDDPRLIIAYQPTRGIDVGAAALVQSRLMEARNAGAAVLLISFELDEILALADRILVMYRGSIAGSFDRSNVDRSQLGRLMAGLQ